MLVDLNATVDQSSSSIGVVEQSLSGRKGSPTGSGGTLCKSLEDISSAFASPTKPIIELSHKTSVKSGASLDELKLSPKFGSILTSKDDNCVGDTVALSAQEKLKRLALRPYCSVETLNLESNRPSGSLTEAGVEEGEGAMARYPPTTLDTVLENMPLVYNSATKKLERRTSEVLGVKIIVHDNVDTSPSPKAALLGRASSANNCSSSEGLPPKSPKTGIFKKGHVRHSSYESAEIQLFPRGVVVAPPATPVLQPSPASHSQSSQQPTCNSTSVMRANSLHR